MRQLFERFLVKASVGWVWMEIEDDSQYRGPACDSVVCRCEVIQEERGQMQMQTQYSKCSRGKVRLDRVSQRESWEVMESV